MVGYKRLTEVCQGLFGLRLSQGAIANMLARVGEAFAAPAERIAEEVRKAEVIASDETSARVKGKTWWQWTFGCATACLLPYDAVRQSPDPDESLMRFLQSSYEAAAETAGWERQSLECSFGVPRVPRTVGD